MLAASLWPRQCGSNCPITVCVCLAYAMHLHSVGKYVVCFLGAVSVVVAAEHSLLHDSGENWAQVTLLIGPGTSFRACEGKLCYASTPLNKVLRQKAGKQQGFFAEFASTRKGKAS